MTPTVHEFVLASGSSLPASIVAKATVIAAFGLMGARLARRNRAAVRHVLLAATFGVLLLLPVASLIVPPVRIAVPIVRQNDTVLPPLDGATDSIPSFTRPDPHSAVRPPNWWSSSPSPFALLIMGWFVGTVLSLIPMIVGLRNLRLLRRSGLPWTDGQKVADRLSLDAGFRWCVEVLLHEELPGPIASGMLQPTILFPLDAQSWGTEDLNRALVHELEHLRRGDVMTHCLARAICALYWFHPLVWMAWRQLVLEAERSCDDAVIARSEATDYADQLVGLARRLSAAAKSPLLAMANRSDLVIRVGAVLDSRQRRGRAGRFMVAFGCAVAAVLAFTISSLRTVSAPQSARSQGAEPTVASGAPLPSFKVASIKPQRSGDPYVSFHPGRYTSTAGTTKDLICEAYGVRDFQISGGPSWIGSEKYDIDAKMEDSVAKEIQNRSVAQQLARFNLMIQSLLADRFKLRLHRETKDLTVYALVVVENGPKLHEAKPDDRYPNGWTSIDGPGYTGVGHTYVGWLKAQGIPMASRNGISLAYLLSLQLDCPIQDRTGLKGIYDIALKWTPDQTQAEFQNQFGYLEGDELRTDKLPRAEPPGPSLFMAIQQQAGLELKPQTAPVEMLVIDHVERPSAN